MKHPFFTVPNSPPRRKYTKRSKSPYQYHSSLPTVFEEKEEGIDEEERSPSPISMAPVSLDLSHYSSIKSSESIHLIFLNRKKTQLEKAPSINEIAVEQTTHLLSNSFSGSLAMMSWSLFLTAIVMLSVALNCPSIFGLAVSLSATAFGLGIALQISLYGSMTEKPESTAVLRLN